MSWISITRRKINGNYVNRGNFQFLSYTASYRLRKKLTYILQDANSNGKAAQSLIALIGRQAHIFNCQSLSDEESHRGTPSPFTYRTGVNWTQFQVEQDQL